jgi:hypothetical protein
MPKRCVVGGRKSRLERVRSMRDEPVKLRAIFGSKHFLPS